MSAIEIPSRYHEATHDSGTVFGKIGVRLLKGYSNALITPQETAAAAWLEKVSEKLRGLLDLEANWDSYGARRISPQSVEFARLLASRLAEAGVDEPRVAASPFGQAALCWYRGRGCVELEVFADGGVEYVSLDVAGEDGCEGTTTDVDYLVRLIQQLL